MIFAKVVRNIVLIGAALLLMAPPAMARDTHHRSAAKKHKAGAGVSGRQAKKSKATGSVKKRRARAGKKAAAVAVKRGPVHYVKATDHFGDTAQGADYLRDQLTSRSAVIMDAPSGDLIYAHNPDMPGQPASTIKVLTGLIALKSLRNDDLVPASRQAARMPRSKIYLRPGKNYMADDLINAVLLASANDASVALAERIAGSERAFAKLMTKKAETLGATNTVCKTANGLTAPGQQTTAHDLAAIFRQAMRDEEFCRRMAFTAVKTSDGKLLRSHNKALWQIDGAEGGKTGYTDVARKTYVGKFSRDGHEIIVALMGSESMWEDVRRLVEFGFHAKTQGMPTVAGRGGHGEERRHSALRVADEARKVSNL